jgi:hypothetical protein
MNVNASMVGKTVYFPELAFHARSPQALKLESTGLGPTLVPVDEGF